MRTEPNRLGIPVTKVTHPWQWIVRDPDGYERCFDTKGAARVYIDAWDEEAA